jgi:small subunit ribosomal protein S9
MAEDERPDSPQEDENNLAASGAAGEPSDGAADDTAAAPDDATPAEEPAPEQPAAEEPAPEQPAAEEPAPEQPAAEEEPAPAEPAAAEEPAGDAAPEEVATETPQSTGGEAAETPSERPARSRDEGEGKKDDVVPGAHLEPDLVLEAERDDDEFARYQDDSGDDGDAATVTEEAQPIARSTIDLAAGARYKATGKRKTAVARVIVKPGGGSYQINGRTLEEFFPRPTLQKTARQPLEAAGYDTRMDVVARIHGGGVSAQAGALRHGIARALVEADPNLRTELKRRGFLTRDAREKERKKAGLKKARKRPQFSKR